MREIGENALAQASSSSNTEAGLQVKIWARLGVSPVPLAL